MPTKRGLGLTVLFLFFGLLLAVSSAAIPETANQQKTLHSYGELPLYFVENQGQLDAKVQFYVKTAAQTLYFTDEGIVFDLLRQTAPATADAQAKNERLVFNLGFEKADKQVTIKGIERQAAAINYFVGPQSNWKTDIPTYKGIIYKEVYPGIDLKIFGDGQDIEYEFIVNPGANPNDILLTYRGIKGLATSDKGELLINTSFGELKETRPYIYQTIAGVKEVAGSFVLHNAVNNSQPGKFSYGFQVASYNTTYPLIIDPTLSYSTYLG